MKVTTGFGYYVEKSTGRRIVKAVLPVGDHPLDNKYDYIEVPNQAALDAIELYMDSSIQLKAEQEKKIQTEIRQAAISSLIVKGELPPDYKD